MSDEPAGPGAAFQAFVALIARLRAPGGCPWDREQTHHSLKPMTIEEAYEVVEAIVATPFPGAEPRLEPRKRIVPPVPRAGVPKVRAARTPWALWTPWAGVSPMPAATRTART